MNTIARGNQEDREPDAGSGACEPEVAYGLSDE